MAVDEPLSFERMLAGERFHYGLELVSTRGLPQPGGQGKVLDLAAALADDPRLGWFSLTDNAGGRVALPPDWTARVLRAHRPQIVLHITCKDLNRSALEGLAWRSAAEGFHNVLALTGDCPVEGYGGRAKGVFDLDSVSLIGMLDAMNRGLEVPGRKGQPQRLPATQFYIGCAVSPFKRLQSELLCQYYKLLRKIRAGARWVIPQLGYDMRKLHEVLLFLQLQGLRVPVIGNVYVLTKTIAGMFHGNEIAGCVVSDELLEQVHKYAAGPDKGRAFFQELAAKQLAVCKGLGFAGGYLGGVHTPEAFDRIVTLAESFGPNDWKDFAREVQFPRKGEFYLFDRDEATGLGVAGQFSPEYQASQKNPRLCGRSPMGYRLSRWMHGLLFTPGRRGFRLAAWVYQWLQRRNGALGRLAYGFERLVKFIGYGCKDCGDCSLPDCAYQCPLYACSKGSRNGPCGGSFDGQCEMKDKRCIWVKAYERTARYGDQRRMLEGPPVYYDARLAGTSSWANTFLLRDHHAPRDGERQE